MLKESFNKDWLFYKTGNPSEINVILPHDAMIFEERDEKQVSGPAGGYFPGGSYIYKKSFFVPGDEEKETWILEFEGAYQDAFVYLNGNFVTSNHNGYRGFYADLSSYLKYDAENNLEVQVKNDKLVNSRWYSGSGLYRPVWLWKGGSIRIAQDGLRISTPEVEEEVSKVELSISIINECIKTTKARLHTTLKDGDGNVVCVESTPVTLFKGENPVIRQRLFVRNARLWSPDEPNLYTCEVKLQSEPKGNAQDNMDPQLMDLAESTFGIRHIQIDPVKGMRINGKRILLRGSCIHHDHGILGAATFADAEERKIRLSKEAGFNAVRIAHQPASKTMLDICDQLGILVMEESFDMWNQAKNSQDYSQVFSDYWEQDVEAIVAKDFNHPSVFLYCIGNEIPELITDTGIHYSRLLSDKFHTMDSTRPVTNSVNGKLLIEGDIIPMLIEMGLLSKEQIAAMTGNADSSQAELGGVLQNAIATGNINEIMTALIGNLERVIEHHSIADKLEEIMSHLDICGYNYMMQRYKIDMEQYPNRIIFGSETTPPDIDKLWTYSENYAACVGDFTWTGWDYIGEAGVGITRYDGKQSFFAPYPGYLAYCGDIDLTGYRRPASYFREIVYGIRKTPYVSVQEPWHYGEPAANTPWSVPETVESWTWAGYEGKPVNVSIYASGDEVALLCNGREIHRAPAGKNHRFQATFETVYEPGELTAISYTEGQETGRFTLVTAKESLNLRTKLNRTQLLADGDDLAYLTIELVDEDGIVYMDRDRKILLMVEGSVVLQGFGSADPFSTENFFDTERTTYRGRLLAALRGTQNGTAKVTVTCEGCEPVTCMLQVTE